MNHLYNYIHDLQNIIFYKRVNWRPIDDRLLKHIAVVSCLLFSFYRAPSRSDNVKFVSPTKKYHFSTLISSNLSLRSRFNIHSPLEYQYFFNVCTTYLGIQIWPNILWSKRSKYNILVLFLVKNQHLISIIETITIFADRSIKTCPSSENYLLFFLCRRFENK